MYNSLNMVPHSNTWWICSSFLDSFYSFIIYASFSIKRWIFSFPSTNCSSKIHSVSLAFLTLSRAIGDDRNGRIFKIFRNTFIEHVLRIVIELCPSEANKFHLTWSWLSKFGWLSNRSSICCTYCNRNCYINSLSLTSSWISTLVNIKSGANKRAGATKLVDVKPWEKVGGAAWSSAFVDIITLVN